MPLFSRRLSIPDHGIGWTLVCHEFLPQKDFSRDIPGFGLLADGEHMFPEQVIVFRVRVETDDFELDALFEQTPCSASPLGGERQIPGAELGAETRLPVRHLVGPVGRVESGADTQRVLQYSLHHLADSVSRWFPAFAPVVRPIAKNDGKGRLRPRQFHRGRRIGPRVFRTYAAVETEAIRNEQADISSRLRVAFANISAVKSAHNLVRFFEHESCGQCTPCREGCGWMTKILERIMGGHGRPADIDLLHDIADNIAPGWRYGMWPYNMTTICFLGPSAAVAVVSALVLFRNEFEELIAAATGPALEPPPTPVAVLGRRKAGEATVA